jgi:branched-chain amino acid transport system substrate-binding protein
MKKVFAKTIRIGFICLILMLPLTIGVPLGAMAADTVKLGQIDPYSGAFEAYGRAWNAGLQFAVDEQNEKGGLLGKKIEIITEDSESKPDVATRKAKKLILENKVNFLTGGMLSSVAGALHRVATAQKTLYFNYAATANELQGKEFSRYAFRLCHNQHNMVTGIVHLMANKPYRKFYHIAADYVGGHDLDKVIRELLKTIVPNATILGTDFHPLGSTKDFGPYITKIIASKADAVIATNFGPDFINFVKQARAMGLKAPYPIFNCLAIHPYLMNELKEDSVGVYWSHEYSLNVKTPENEEMIKKYHERHKNDKDFLTQWPFPDLAMAILGWKMTFAAVEKAGSLDPEKVIETYEGFQYKTPVGMWTMRKCDHQAIMPIFAGGIEGGPNPFYNFPWSGPNIMEFSPDKVVLPATPDYNPRCP